MSKLPPKDWKEFALKDAALKNDRYSFTGGPFGSNLKAEDYTESGVRIIQLQNIGEGQFLNKYKIFTSEQKADELSSCNIFPGDIILSKMGDPVARATIIPNFHSRYLMASDGIRLAVDKDRFDTKFVHDSINADRFRNQAETISTGTTRKRIGLTDLRELTFLAPPLPEQQKIASILTAVDEVIESTTAQINKLKDLKIGMMQELLTKGIGHTEFKDSAVGRIPKEWELKELNEIVDQSRPITYGIVQAGPHINGGVPYIRVSDMVGRQLSTDGMMRTAFEIADKFKRSSVIEGDIVYALRGVIGHVQIVPKTLEGANLTQGTARISRSDFIKSEYLIWALRSPYVALQNDMEAKGSTFREVTLASLRSILVCVPNLIEQSKIASVMESLQLKLDKLEGKLTNIQSVKKALLQELLTGDVRVKVN